MTTLKGRCAIVTGGGRGIGRAIVLRLCALKVRVLAVARSADELAETVSLAGENAVALSCDLGADQAPKKIINAALKHFGKLDLLIHSAGAYNAARNVDLDIEALDEMYRVNLRAPFAVTRAALPALIKSKGQVLFINSTVTRATHLAGRGGYVAMQQGVKAIADSYRDEVNELGVRVISVYAGKSATSLQERAHSEANLPYSPENLLQPEDIARAVSDALQLSRTAEPTDLYLRPMIKHVAL